MNKLILCGYKELDYIVNSQGAFAGYVITA